MRVLITGGAGFIGSHLVEAGRQAGWEMRVVDDLSRGSPAHLPGLSSFLRVGYYWAEDREEVERWSALVGRCPSRRGREADGMREVERWSRLG